MSVIVKDVPFLHMIVLFITHRPPSLPTAAPPTRTSSATFDYINIAGDAIEKGKWYLLCFTFANRNIYYLTFFVVSYMHKDKDTAYTRSCNRVEINSKRGRERHREYTTTDKCRCGVDSSDLQMR